MTEDPDPRKIFPIEHYRRPGAPPPGADPPREPAVSEDDDEVELPEDFDSDLFDDGLDDDATAFGAAEPPAPGLWERVGDIHPGYTYGLVLLILVSFALELVTATLRSGDLLAGGSLSSPFITAGAAAWQPFRAGEWWRLLSSILLHANVLHVGSNLLALTVLGGVAERAYGHSRFLVLFVVAGAFGSVASLAHQSSMVAGGGSIGASGAVFGVGRGGVPHARAPARMARTCAHRGHVAAPPVQFRRRVRAPGHRQLGPRGGRAGGSRARARAAVHAPPERAPRKRGRAPGLGRGRIRGARGARRERCRGVRSLTPPVIACAP
jgi:membrane associated rhomboid family serine protease